MRRSTIVYLVGKMMLVEAFLLVFPLIISLIYREAFKFQLAYLLVIAMLLVISLLSGWKPPQGMKILPKDGVIAVALSWVLMSFFGGLPFVFTDEIPNLADAFFETASGFTTTGSSILSDLSLLSHSALFWRSFTHLVGGMGVLVFALAILPGSSSDSVQLMRAEVPGPIFGKLVSKLSQTARILYLIYLGMTLVLVLILVLTGVPLFDSLLLSFGTAGTGGFSINNAGFTIYPHPHLVEWIIGVGMLVFGVNFNLYFFLLLGSVKDVFKDEELRSYLAVVSMAVVLIFTDLFLKQRQLGVSLRSVFFTVSSVITTTGYATADFGLWGPLPQMILLLLMFIGGCAGSTAGGFKVSRIIIYFKMAILELKKISNPRRVLTLTFNGKKLEKGTKLATMNYLAVYILVFLIILFSVSLEAPDFLTSFSSVAATFNNIGPGLGQVGPTQNFSAYSNLNTVILALGMIAGRLEIYPIILLFAPSTLKKLFY